jgi:hypothetical protein
LGKLSATTPASVIFLSTKGLALDSTLSPKRAVRGKKSLPTFPTEEFVFVPLDLTACGLDDVGIGLWEPATGLVAPGTSWGGQLVLERSVEAFLSEHRGEAITDFIGGQFHLIKGLPGPILVLGRSEKIGQFFHQFASSSLLLSVHALLHLARTFVTSTPHPGFDAHILTTSVPIANRDMHPRRMVIENTLDVVLRACYFAWQSYFEPPATGE